MNWLLAAALVIVVLGIDPASARADNVQGAACTAPATAGISGSSNGASLVQPAGGNNLVCVSGTWQYPQYILGTAAAAAGSSCSGSPVGTLRWNTTLTNVEVCDGTNWRFLAASTTSCGSPSGLTFTNVTNASLGTTYTSNTATITFSGCSSGGLSVSVSGAATAQISINGGAWGTSGSISSGQTLQVRLTSSGSVSTTSTATVTVGGSSTNWTVTTRSGSLKVFATANGYLMAAIGGLSGADALCQSEAGAAGYAGTYKAILSDQSTSAASRLTLSYPIVNAYDGSTVAASNLWIGTISNIIVTPSGGNYGFPGAVITGTHSNGSLYAGSTCSSWTSSSGNPQVGFEYIAGAWVDGDNTGYYKTCAVTSGLYCIQQ